MPKLFTAQYDGSCCSCGADIEPGDEIGYVDDEINCERCWRDAHE